MEEQGIATRTDTNDKGQSNEVAESVRSERIINGTPKQDRASAEGSVQFYVNDLKFGGDIAPQHSAPSGEVNMEATINADDVIRAGGFGARDGLSSFLPVASDSTDFEASLLDARDYEESQGERRRPGLGWSEDRGT